MARMECERKTFQKNYRSDFMNKYDVKKREEVGYKDMEKYEFGGLEIDELLTNGYLMYVPYGIHVDIFNAIEQGIRSMQRHKESIQHSMKEIEIESLKNNLKLQIDGLDKQIDVLTKIHGIVTQV
jgi:hypothetical protein